MKVLILANNDGGLLHFRGELIAELVKARHEVIFCIPSGELVPEIEKLGASFIDNPFLIRRGTNPVDDVQLIRFYRKVLKRIQRLISDLSRTH